MPPRTSFLSEKPIRSSLLIEADFLSGPCQLRQLRQPDVAAPLRLRDGKDDL
jgi:hypothetical protein